MNAKKKGKLKIKRFADVKFVDIYCTINYDVFNKAIIQEVKRYFK